MEIGERIQRYLNECPPAVSGQGGHDQTFFVACRLINGFDLSEDQAFYWLSEYNRKCDPPWNDRELAHKIRSAMSTSHDKPRGHLLGDSRRYAPGDLKRNSKAMPAAAAPKVKVDAAPAMEKFLNSFRCTEAELSEASPVRLENWTNGGWVMLSNLFKPDELVNYVIDFKPYEKKSNKTIKANPIGVGVTATVKELVRDWGLSGTPSSDAGGWLRINPVDGNGVNDKNITAFRYALIEFDDVALDLQLSFLSKVPLPISAILTSGGKSVHAWVRVDADSFEEYEQLVLRMREVMTRFGIDRANKNPSRLSRLVGITRKIGATGDGKQKLLYLNPEPLQKAIFSDEGIAP